MTAPMSTRVAEKVSGVLSSRFSRRGFFARSAIVGSAVAASPVGFALKPTTAYAAVCNCQGSACQCGSLCCDGYTEFCCTLTGNNKCPAGTLMGGWWKADGSGMCSGARYYMDCNAPCNGCGCGGNGICSGSCSGTGCGCANGDCNNRKAGCTNFRYGQCNQAIPCLGPILCRVVTCIAPWEVDASCTTAVRVDQATTFHDRACLHRTIGNLDHAGEENGRIRVRGWALDYDTAGPVRVEVYSDNVLIGSATANGRRDDVGAANPGHGPFHGFDFLVDGRTGSHDICVYAINAAGPGGNQLIGCRRIALNNPIGSIDAVSAGLGTMKVSGWAIDPDTTGPIKVRVYVNNVYKGEHTANRSRPDVGAAFPGFGSNHGYSAEFPIQNGAKNVCVYAMNVGLGSVNTLIGCVPYEVGTPFGSFEVASPRPGGIRVSGWAIDPDTPSSIKVHVYVDGKFAREATAAIDRPDVGRSHPGYGNAHGFSVDVAAAAGSRQVCVYMINDGAGPNPAIGCKTVQVMAGTPIGSLDEVTTGPGKVRARGWAIDPDIAGPVKVHVYVDGKVAREGEARLNRPDIGARYPAYGSAHGYDIEVPAGAGAHQVCVYVLNDTPGHNPMIGCKAATVRGGNPFGSLDAVTAGPSAVRIRGWAIDPDTADAVEIHVYAGGRYLGATTANKARTDVAARNPGYGPAHGFEASFPLAGGFHDVCVYAINKATGTTNPLVGCRSVFIGGAPFGSLDAVSASGGSISVRGWAIDPDTADPTIVHVYIDDRLKGAVAADKDRTDVASAYPGYGAAHGFNGSFPVSAGSHRVCVYAINKAGAGDNPLLACRTVVA